MVSNPFDNYLDLVEAARVLGIHPQSLRRLIKQKKVPAVLFAGKYLIERDKLEIFKDMKQRVVLGLESADPIKTASKKER